MLDNVVLGLEGHDARERGRAALAEVGLAGRERAWPNELAVTPADRVLVLDDGRIAVDRRIALDRPRHAADPEFVAHRETLLGVDG